MGRLITLNWRVIRGWALGLQWVVLAKMFAIMVGQKLRVKLKIIPNCLPIFGDGLLKKSFKLQKNGLLFKAIVQIIYVSK